MDFDKTPAVVALCVAGKFKAIHHGVAEFALHEFFVGESAGEVLQGGNDAGVSYPQEFAIVGERIKECLDTPVHIVKAFALGELEPPQVLHPAGHFCTGDGGELLSFPGSKIDFHKGVFFIDGKSRSFRNGLRQPQATQQGAAEQSGGLGACFQVVFDGLPRFLGKRGGDVKVQASVADVLGVVGLGMSESPENHGPNLENLAIGQKNVTKCL